MIVNDNALLTICRSSFPQRRGIFIKAANPLESEHHHLTALHLVRQNADGQDEPIPLILRRYPSPLVWHTFDAPHRAKREFATLQYLEANGFPVPSPQAHGSDDEGCWLLEGVVRGHNWWRPLGAVDFSAVLPGLVRRQVALMARLHSLEIEELNAPAYNLPTITIPDVLETYRKAAQESGDQAAVTAVRDVKEIMLRVEERPPRLLHGDASLTNLLVDDDDQVVGWLDWDEAVLGDPRWDVAALHASLCGSYAMPQLAARSVVEYGQETVRPVKDIEVWVAALAVFRWVQCAWLKHRIAAEEDIAFPSLDRFVDAYDSHRAWALAMLQEAEVGGSDG